MDGRTAELNRRSGQRPSHGGGNRRRKPPRGDLRLNPEVSASDDLAEGKVILDPGVDVQAMALRLNNRSICRFVPPGPASASWPTDADPVFRFDRRRESRAATDGWANVICLDPYKSFLGGTVRLLDISHSGLGFRSERPIPAGEYVEVRLAPFRVRGRIAVVARCDEVAATIDPGTGETVTPRHYRIGVRHAHATRAA